MLRTIHAHSTEFRRESNKNKCICFAKGHEIQQKRKRENNKIVKFTESGRE